MNATYTTFNATIEGDPYAPFIYCFVSMGALSALQVVLAIAFIVYYEAQWFNHFNMQLIGMGVSLVGNFVFNGLSYDEAWSSGGTDPITILVSIGSNFFGGCPTVAYSLFAYQRGRAIIPPRQWLIQRLLLSAVVLQVSLNVLSAITGSLCWTVYFFNGDIRSLLVDISLYVTFVSYALLTVFDLFLLGLFFTRVRQTRLDGATTNEQFSIICRYGIVAGLLCLLSTAFFLAYGEISDAPWINWLFFASCCCMYGVWCSQLAMKVDLMRLSNRVRSTSLEVSSRY
ncbi:hypothetical protein BC830DRAFT_1140891 [Chytriomyces sp. MP71]|nr:hypothetical protein BC830DRAFT_1140891 [Chytriomyces sp. MP71]